MLLLQNLPFIKHWLHLVLSAQVIMSILLCIFYYILRATYQIILTLIYILPNPVVNQPANLNVENIK